jgi:hypothetical protein
VARSRMGDFMSENSGKPRLILGDWQKALVNHPTAQPETSAPAAWGRFSRLSLENTEFMVIIVDYEEVGVKRRRRSGQQQHSKEKRYGLPDEVADAGGGCPLA